MPRLSRSQLTEASWQLVNSGLAQAGEVTVAGWRLSRGWSLARPGRGCRASSRRQNMVAV